MVRFSRLEDRVVLDWSVLVRFVNLNGPSWTVTTNSRLMLKLMFEEKWTVSTVFMLVISSRGDSYLISSMLNALHFRVFTMAAITRLNMML